MQPSLGTEYNVSIPPQLRLQHMAEAGFRNVHWCCHWGDDFVYHDSEIEQIRRWFDELGLTCPDLHATSGQEKNWVSSTEYVRQAGVELVRNRIRMAEVLGAKVIVLHMSPESGRTPDEATVERSRRSIDDVINDLERCDISIALENLLYINANRDLLERVFACVDSPRIGLCYDSGHGQITGDGIELLQRHQQRLLALHLHGNDGRRDIHLLPGAGNVDWDRLVALIADSPYNGPLTLEAMMGSQCQADERRFLEEAHRIAEQISEQIQARRDHTQAD